MVDSGEFLKLGRVSQFHKADFIGKSINIGRF